MAEFDGTLGNLASMEPSGLLQHLELFERNAKKHPDAVRGDKERAEKILEQMNRTSRIQGNSREYEQLREAMQRYARGKDTVIEQEKLEEQIKKVQKDPNFRKAMEGLNNEKGLQELCSRARSGELNGLDGYAKQEQKHQNRRIEMVAE